MTAYPLLPRHSLLPDLERSRAVLVGCDDGVLHHPSIERPEQLTRELAEALTSPDAAMAFRARYTEVLHHPAGMLDAVRNAAEAATDVLLFYYAGKSLPDPRAIAEIMSTSRAARPVVILDCDNGGGAMNYFTNLVPIASVLAGRDGFSLTLDPFTPSLVQGLSRGVWEGPEMLDLVALRSAIEASFAETRFHVESEYILGPSDLMMRLPFRRLALGINPSLSREGCVSDRRPTQRTVELPRDVAVVFEENS